MLRNLGFSQRKDISTDKASPEPCYFCPVIIFLPQTSDPMPEAVSASA